MKFKLWLFYKGMLIFFLATHFLIILLLYCTLTMAWLVLFIQNLLFLNPVT